MSATGEIYNKPPLMWSTIQSSNGINKNLNIHPATQNHVRISKKQNIQKLIQAATKNIPGASRIIDQHFSEKSYSSFNHVTQNRAMYEHLHDNPF